jgi:hypothetical protein
MPKYYFNVHDVTSRTDDIGEELPDDATAWNEATLVAGELFKGIDGKFQLGQEWSLGVRPAPLPTIAKCRRS